MLKKVLAHSAGFFAGIVGFFGIKHSLVTITMLIINRSTIDKALIAGALTAYAETVLGSIWNESQSKKIQLPIENNDIEAGVPLVDTTAQEKNEPLLVITPLAQAVFFAMTTAKACDNTICTKQDINEALTYWKYWP
jgi:hypothetical protein